MHSFKFQHSLQSETIFFVSNGCLTMKQWIDEKKKGPTQAEKNKNNVRSDLNKKEKHPGKC